MRSGAESEKERFFAQIVFLRNGFLLFGLILRRFVKICACSPLSARAAPIIWAASDYMWISVQFGVSLF